MAKVQSSSSWKALHKADHRTLPGRRYRIRGAFNHIEQPLPHTACGCRFALYCAQVVGAWTWEQDGDSPSISVRPRSGCVIGGYVSDVYRLGGTYISPACSQSAVNLSRRNSCFQWGRLLARKRLHYLAPRRHLRRQTVKTIRNSQKFSLPTEPS